MAVNLNPPKNVLPVLGVELATCASGMRYKGRDDLTVMSFTEGTRCAAVFTQSKTCAAPVFVAREHLESNAIRALVINAGNANAATGAQGLANARASCALVANRLSISEQQVLPFSTGVIGEQLPMTEFSRGLDNLSSHFSQDNWLMAASAIMTTDTVAKAVSKQLEINGKTITVTGIAKGAGMMCPNMATLLSFVATDAEIDQRQLIRWLQRGVAQSFNRITVDSDTSTNDALVLIATGHQKTGVRSEIDDERLYQAIESVLIDLATAVIRDAEGATKFVTIRVNGGASEQDCQAVAYSIAHSPLVKTALYASDPNWGRIVMALGKAPVEHLDFDRTDIKIGDVDLLIQGQPAADYTEARGQSVFKQAEIEINFDLNMGTAQYHLWTSDLSHNYVSVNADYRS